MAKPSGTATAQAASLADDYRRIRQTTRILAEPLSPEDAALQSMPCASPAKWHLAHTSWFFEQRVLRVARGLISRPDLETVLDYRDWTDLRMLAVLNDAAEAPRFADVIEFGLHPSSATRNACSRT